MQSLAQARWKRMRAVELALEGRSYDEIASAVGYSHRGSAHRSVTKALAERQVEAVGELRRTEVERLDRLQASVWPKAMSGDVGAAQLIVRIIDRRIRLLGLDRELDESGQKQLVIGTG